MQVGACVGSLGFDRAADNRMLSLLQRQGRLVVVEIWPSAYRHGITDDEIRHAVANTIRVISLDDVDMHIGPAGADGALIEVGVLVVDDDRLAVIHAMPARSKFLR